MAAAASALTTLACGTTAEARCANVVVDDVVAAAFGPAADTPSLLLEGSDLPVELPVASTDASVAVATGSASVGSSSSFCNRSK